MKTRDELIANINNRLTDLVNARAELSSAENREDPLIFVVDQANAYREHTTQ